MVRIPGFHPGDPGSSPGRGTTRVSYLVPGDIAIIYELGRNYELPIVYGATTTWPEYV